METLHIQTACILALVTYLLFFCEDKYNWTLAVLIYGSATMLTGGYWLADAFTGAGITEAVLFHIMYGLNGLELPEFQDYILVAFFSILTVVLIAYFSWHFMRRRKKSQRKYKVAELVALSGLGVFATCLHPAALQSVQIVSNMFANAEVSLSEELTSFNTEKPASPHPKNLVYIYAESFERTFLDDNLFPGLAPNLADLERNSLRIEGIRQAPLTDWTIAGMVASQCGMPLATFRVDRNEFSNVSGFLPGATCVGDILNQAGYYSVFMGGADLKFAGKGRFYKEHGFNEVIGKHELEAATQQRLPLSKWGVYDDTLLQAALNKFKSLTDSKKPFALFLLTLDTHPPVGHIPPSCQGETYQSGEYGILNSAHCSDKLISGFIKAIEKYHAENLLIIVASDHLQMRNDIYEYLVSHDDQRENLFFARGADIRPQLVKRAATTLDIFPTLLHLLGWKLEGAALGRNLLGPSKTLTEKYGKKRFFSCLQKWRTELWEMWNPRSHIIEAGSVSP